MQKLAARRFCTPIKNAAAYVASPAPLGSLAPPCPVGSKKSNLASSFTYYLGRPHPRGCHFHDTGTGRTVVVCAQKSARLLGLDSSVSQDTTGGRLCAGRSEPARCVNACGRPSHQLIARGIARRLSGRHTGGDRLPSSIRPWEKRREKPPKSSGGIPLCESRWPVLCA